jgi:hypothetical protein
MNNDDGNIFDDILIDVIFEVVVDVSYHVNHAGILRLNLDDL